ncbi:T9SS type A sorting domain-containing protein [Aurantibacillus circumpalustris]|uniref:T9SS type A sorting domain-containing protein n=1 Tax=Aurantibacillus circumpalustris TaxID=3036359 RepID=UPI00295C1867|nr:T9SS type A sorting domain-containing protein [Aurantibacillus circumpalustris]
MRFWVKANSSVYQNAGTTLCANNTAVQQWNDLSGNGFNATQATSGVRPTYFSSGANGNPVVRFAGTHFLDVASLGINGTSDYSGFFVVKLTSANAGGTNDGAGDYVLDRTTGTNELYDIKVVASGGTNRFFFQKRNDGGGNLGGPTSTTVIDPNGFQLVSIDRVYNSSSNTLSRIYVNSILEATQSNASETTTPPNMRIGRHATNTTGGMNGDLSEIVIYNNIPSATNKQRIESYLAIKYGFSLNQSTSINYLSSGGTVIYPATTTHSGYVTDITGIGQDNGSGLNQSNSKNQSSNDFIRMQNPSALSNGDFLMWGSNNATMITPNTVDVDGSAVLRRLSRVWRVAHTGNIGTVDFSIDLSIVPGAKVQADLRLLIDGDGDGFADNDVAPLTGILTGNLFTVAGVNFSDGDYFTIGSVSPGTTPLPIELTEFRSTCHEKTIDLNWTTISETGNAFFVIERSSDGENWLDLKHIEGSGTTKTYKKYSFTDGFKKNELRYYRLTQVDYDGNTETFDLISSNCINGDDKMIIYPNPAINELSVELNLSKNYGTAEIKIINALGKLCLLEKMELKKGNVTIKIPLSLKSGAYTLLLHSELVNFSSQKLIIQ